MHGFLANLTMARPFRIGLVLTCLWLGLGVLSAGAESEESKKDIPGSQQDTGLSVDNLKKQITNLDGQIQKLREQSLALQEKTRAKLQAQLDILKQQQDALIPRIEKLRDNSERAWQDIKENIKKAIEDLNASAETMDK